MAKAQQQQQSAKAAAKKRIVKVDSFGDAHVNATFNNLIISISNKQGQVISWSTRHTLHKWLLQMLLRKHWMQV
jgi:small subunit ribosomal protein S11